MITEEFTAVSPSRRQLRQTIVGLIALPLSMLPFIAYGTFTPEGRLVRDRAIVALHPPKLPELSSVQIESIAGSAPRYSDAVMVLAYHGIGSSDAEGGFVISPERFGEHIATLRTAGMNDVTADEVARAFEHGDPLPPNAVMITFDDGRADAMMFADRLLDEADMSATMFVISGAAEKPGVYYASWDALEDYSRSGRWDIQSHTAALHREQEVSDGRMLPALTSLTAGESLEEYRARVRSDLARASSAIQAHTGRRPVAFAYPFGAYGVDRTNNSKIQQILHEEVVRRYELAFHQDEQDSIPLATSAQDPLGLRRLEVEDWSGAELLLRIGESARRSERARS